MKLFGTDGIRGSFGEPPIDRPTLTALAYQLGRSLQEDGKEPLFVIGGDSRSSTETLAQWLSTGLTAAGGRVLWAGLLPTPGVAYLTLRLGADCGIAISASHNPWRDNGVKLIGRDGFKWSADDEQGLEDRIEEETDLPTLDATLGKADPELQDLYLDTLLSTFAEDRPLDGLRMAIDSANGAASPYARRLFEELGATVHSFHDQPTGRNINVDCGSTCSSEIARLTVESGSDLGVAFDGDADRLIVADEKGQILDGDAILYLWACDLKRNGRLVPARIVATQMSNLGLEEALAHNGIEVVRCEVGDRAVVQAMRRQSILLGGEQSGHLVHLDLGTTGDGLQSALQVAIRAHAEPTSRLAEGFRRYPQTLRNVVVSRKENFDSIPGLAELLESIETRLGGEGRVLLRYSGTEPLARIMIEGRAQHEIDSMAGEIESAIERYLN